MAVAPVPPHVLLLAALLGAIPPAPPAHPRTPPPLPRVVANDNRVPAGHLANGELRLRLVARPATWYPEADDGPHADVIALADEDGAPSIPAPLIRVPEGTVINATIRNALADSVLYLHGLSTRPAERDDSIAIPPGESRSVRFAAGAPGTYFYYATAGNRDYSTRRHERELMGGAFIVDAPGERTDDRVFVMNIWGDSADATHYHQALAINGRSWPHTERITATVGDTLRWRVVNATARNHPLHLHGFYFQVESRGTMLRDTLYAPGARRSVVTEDVSLATTMRMSWTPDRPGNWLFHCHLTFHVIPFARLDGHEEETHSDNPMHHMAGLVLGIQVRPRPGEVARAPAAERALTLYVNEAPRRHRAPRALGFVLQEGTAPPAPDSVLIPGSVLVLHRGEPTDITVVNRLRESTAIHWHGIELESFSDGVAGWSGADAAMAPAVAPGGRFTAHLILPRSGTFMYHTHLSDLEQITSGLYGAIVVLDPGQSLDPRTDHVLVTGWDGPVVFPTANMVVNGDSVGPPIAAAVGERHRFRFVNIGPANRLVYEIRRAGDRASWRPLAKDGADLPAAMAVEGPAARRLAVGETFDAEFRPGEPGDYELVAHLPAPGSPLVYRQAIRVH
jgi:FtsP/CotA-like multicopper oxidase with cupredoxin domain